jgi:hypothetical protein
MASTLGLIGIEAITVRTIGDPVSLRESLPPEEVQPLPEELARRMRCCMIRRFFAQFRPFFDRERGGRRRRWRFTCG